MPKIRFTPPITDWDGIALVGIRYWPGDEGKRLDLMRACFPKFLAVQQQVHPEVFASKAFWDQANRICSALGGWGAIGDAPRYSDFKSEMAELSEQGSWVGIALVLAEQLISQGVPAELVTLNRMAYLLDEFGIHLLKKRIPADTFMRAWEKFKPVAHLWAGFLTGTGAWDGEQLLGPLGPLSEVGPQFEQTMLNQILHSQQFYRFGVSHKPPRARTTLLDPNDAWKVEAEVEGPPFQLAPFRPALIKALKVYPKTKS